MSAAQTFDTAASEYELQLRQGITLSGENAEYFVNGRIQFLADFLDAANATPPERVLDFGCGVGNACYELRSRLGARHLTGVDCSSDSLALAQQRWGEDGYDWSVDGACIATESIDVAYTSGVFHHIAPEQRQEELKRIFSWLRPGGLFVLFENNPWNPGTRWVMSRIPFDRDAICLSPLETRKRMRQVGWQVASTRSLFFFPRSLAWLRGTERLFAPIPLGAQYVVIGRKP